MDTLTDVILSSNRSWSWSKKQRRAYHRLISGIKRSFAVGDDLRFLTLTSARGSEFSDLNRHFSVLVKRIRRKFGRFEYWKIRTNEGFGVLHVLYRGSFMLQRWLSRSWLEVHGAKIVDIRALRGGAKGIARYLISGYLAKQTFERMSWSWRWVFKGFVGEWRLYLLRFSFQEAVRRWNGLLESPIIVFSQSVLDGG